MNRPDCWEILGINPTRNPDRIRNAFRKKAKLYHPDSLAHITLTKEKYSFIEIKAAESEALRRAQSDNLSTTYEKLSEKTVEQIFSTNKFNYLFKSFSNLSLRKLFQILCVFPVLLVCSLGLEKIQSSGEARSLAQKRTCGMSEGGLAEQGRCGGQKQRKRCKGQHRFVPFADLSTMSRHSSIKGS